MTYPHRPLGHLCSSSTAGPAVPHDYLQDLAILGDSGRHVVYYDQLECGRSDRPDDPALWIVDTFVEEIDVVRDTLGLDRVHILGHSWGGWLALQYALGRPSGLDSLVLASTCASLLSFASETRRLKESLPAEVQRTIDEHEAAGTTDNEAYLEATMAYFTRWICQLDLPWPDHVMHALNNINDGLYATMQGPEWNVTGNLKDWDVTARLGELELPVLVTSGRHDEMTDAVVSPLVAGISGAEWVVFDTGAHLAPVEEPERYRQVLATFLNRVEATPGLNSHPAPGR